MNKVITDYLNDIKSLCDGFDVSETESFFAEAEKAYRSGKKIFIAGNGGSAGTANHFMCDFSKNAVTGDAKKAKLISLSSNIEYVTAIGNDISFDSIFSQQLKNLMDDGDLVILISASGNSPDIISAAEYAKSRNGTVIGLTGFSGGALKNMSDVSVNFPVKSYEQSEDMHMIVLHMLVCYFKSLRL